MKIGGQIPITPQTPTSGEQDQQIRNVANLYEQQFLNEMVKAMRNTVQQDGILKPSFAQKLYEGQLDQQYVDVWSQRGGVGLSDIIYQQIKEKYFPDPGSIVPPPQGPLPLRKMHEMQPGSVKSLNGALYQFQLPSSSVVQSPWSGAVEAAFQNEEREQVVRLKHDNGLISTMIFTGTLEGLTPGQAIGPGGVIGNLSKQNPTLKWHIRPQGAT